MKLHFLHLEDLRKSGLTDETIIEAGIESVAPGDINRELGYSPSGLMSTYRIPYPQTDGFCRYRAFYDGNTLEGKPKYLQVKGTGNRLYIPKKARVILNEFSIPLYFTEGEKKTAKACQEGLPCIGLSGLWNWSNGNKALISDFDKVTLSNRKVYVVPDSDWLEPNKHGYKKNLEQAVKEFSYRLIKRGARVFIVKLPQGINDENGVG